MTRTSGVGRWGPTSEAARWGAGVPIDYALTRTSGVGRWGPTSEAARWGAGVPIDQP
jgi:hypothetical protein